MSKFENLSDIWKIKKRGQRDSERHKQLIEKTIRKNGKDLITEYNIIKSDGNQKIKIPVKYLDRYRFKYGKFNNDSGVGQGVGGKPGDKYQIKKRSDDPGEPGNEEGELTFDAEITVDELVNILLQELNLPWMDPTNTSQIEIETEDISSIEKTGIMPNLDIKKSLFENIKRNAAKGNPKVGPFKKDDLRYKSWETETEYVSNATAYLMIDRSGSMDQEKTYIAKSFYFWMVQFLKKRYKNVDLVFIAHDTQAQIVDEKDFFKVSSNGGTMCSSAFDLAYRHMKSHHPPESYNNYLFLFSDGDNYPEDNLKCIELVNKLLPLTKAIGYGEIILETHSFGPWFKMENLLSQALKYKIKSDKLMSKQFHRKDDVYDGLKHFFGVKEK